MHNNPNTSWLSATFLYFSSFKSNQCCVLNAFQKPHLNFERIISKNVDSYLLFSFSNSLGIIRRMQTFTVSLRGIIIKLSVFQIVWVLFGECRLPLCLFVVLSLNLMILFDTKLMMWLFSKIYYYLWRLLCQNSTKLFRSFPNKRWTTIYLPCMRTSSLIIAHFRNLLCSSCRFIIAFKIY